MSSLDMLSELATLQLELERDVEEAEQILEGKKKALADVAANLLPSVMEELGLETFTLTNGTKIGINTTIRANIASDRWPAAIEWLNANGHAGLLRHTFVVAPSNDDERNELRSLLEQSHVQWAENPTIHHKTLSAFVKARLEEGVDIPLETFGVFRQRTSKISLPK